MKELIFITTAQNLHENLYWFDKNDLDDKSIDIEVTISNSICSMKRSEGGSSFEHLFDPFSCNEDEKNEIIAAIRNKDI